MPEVDQITYSLKELTALMLRDRGIRSGLWMIYTRFNFGVTNIASPEPGGPAGPGVISQLSQVGIQRAPEPGPLSVDASEVWREQKPTSVRRGRASKK